MTLNNVMNTIPCCDIVTVEDYIKGEIYVDRETVENVIHGNDKRWHHDLKNCRVYGIEAGKVYGDIIIKIVKE